MLSVVQLARDYAKNKPEHDKRRAEGVIRERNVEGKIAIVTGSNSGIGKETALELARRGAVVIMACRNIKIAQEALADILSKVPDARVDLLKLDLSDLASIRAFAATIKRVYPRVDILINNAGVMIQQIKKTKEGFETNMGVNHLGHHLVTILLLSHLKKGAPSRIICVSSSMLHLANLNLDDIMLDHQSAGFMNYTPYANSKLANALFSKELARRLRSLGDEGMGISTFSVCPGMVRTNFFRNTPWYRRTSTKLLLKFGAFDAQKGCETILYCALHNGLEQESGKMYRFLGRWDEVEEKLDDKLGKELWDKSEKLVGLPPFSKSAFADETVAHLSHL